MLVSVRTHVQYVSAFIRPNIRLYKNKNNYKTEEEKNSIQFSIESRVLFLATPPWDSASSPKPLTYRIWIPAFTNTLAIYRIIAQVGAYSYTIYILDFVHAYVSMHPAYYELPCNCPKSLVSSTYSSHTCLVLWR